MAAPADSGQRTAPGLLRRAARVLRPGHEHSAFSATVLLMGAVMLSRVIGYVREAYIAYAFGAGAQTDAYVAAFTIPDWLNYLVAGGTVSITFIAIFSRYTAEGREEEAQKAFSVIVTVMSVVLIAGIVLAQVFTPQIERLIFPKFTA
ncbi:MAG TPA: lipid II flippase MurJ, partial [Terriglobales bacterium]|nr:lipid II flippase MurJ [Terriglobales bacterium]